jgi:uncharacterized membrane protein YccC
MLTALSHLADAFAAFGRELGQIRFGDSRARESWKAILSVFLALFVAFSLFTVNDAFWAAFSAFMVPRASATETMKRGLYRIYGTIGGGLVGFLFAGIVANSAIGQLISMVLIGFFSIFQTQTSRYPYAWMFFGLTAELILSLTIGSPREVTPFVAIRVAEIMIGVGACVLVSLLFEALWPINEEPAASPASEDIPVWRGWLSKSWVDDHRLALVHATRGAIAIGLLFFIWRIIELTNFLDSAVSAYLVLLVPAAPIRKADESAIVGRGMQRLTGCFLGGVFALAILSGFKDSTPMWIMGLAIGVWIAAWVQNGKGASYAGSQFALALFVTFVQGNGPPHDLLPAWLRFQGVLVGLFALGLVQLAWPLQMVTSSTDGDRLKY